jgi:putative addiction module CopG family antidote
MNARGIEPDMPSAYPSDLNEFVQTEIASGRHRSPDELITAALKVYRELKKRHSSLRQDVLAAIQEADAGKAKPLDAASLLQRVNDRLAARGITK